LRAERQLQQDLPAVWINAARMALAAEELQHAQTPPLKWAGGKRWLLPHLRSIWAAHSQRRLVEPFAGGLAIALGLRPRRALLSDVNVHLIAFYQWIQRGLDPGAVNVPFENDRAVFDRNRARFNALIAEGNAHSQEAAVLFYYLNRTAFNGLCRFNASGFYNVPFGRHKAIPYRDARGFAHYRSVLKGYEFRCVDFAALPLRRTDFIYADPPYDVEFTSYAAGGFGWSDQVRLAAWLSRHPGPVVVSNQATERIVTLYREHGFVLQMLAAPRRISCDGNREGSLEMLATRHL
jgi:DNA adenine methylase